MDTLSLARQYVAEDNQVMAVALLTQYITDCPQSVDALLLRGQLLLAMGDKRGAEADMRRVLELRPETAAGVSGQYTAEGKER